MGNLVSGRKVPTVVAFLALIALAAFLIVNQFSPNAIADEPEMEDFVGFWMAVDPTDGGVINLSIINDDGSAEIGVAQDYVSLCAGGRALVDGADFTISQGQLGGINHKLLRYNPPRRSNNTCGLRSYDGRHSTT